MARDYGDIFNTGDMSDRELRELVTQQLTEYPNLDPGWIEVDVTDGLVTLSGTVGTDGEKQVAEKVVAEILGVERYTNELMVNELHREALPEDADAAMTAESEADDHFGEGPGQHSDTASHLVEDPDAEAFGTRDMQRSVQEGATYVPPDRPIPDGYNSEEDH
jgi:hypothetical protein